ncbi:Integrin alpha-PS1 [Nymphon striatum]|nr:Integrin alpha-PS1 [Nymphon striatum]
MSETAERSETGSPTIGLIQSALFHTKILVGAPKDDTNQPGTNKTGAVYRCDFNTNQNDCEQLNIEYDTKPPPSNILKDDQWLGVTVVSEGSGGYVMACAHRYVSKGADFRWGNGICYSLDQNLNKNRSWQPCMNRPVYKAHEQFGFCQAGTSGALTKDHKIVIGTPGPYTWRGTVFLNSVSFGLRDDKTWYMGPVLDEESPVEKYSYLGMSVTTGKFFPNSESSYIAGAPRANGTGQVVFFSKNPSGGEKFSVDLILKGDRFASSFGYTLASADFNNDNFEDLIVGAPFHYDKDTDGAIYIYMNTAKGLKPDTKPRLITGAKNSRFGFAIEATGDLNKDGYTDLAVGAPYEGLGTVYIYSGGKDGLSEKPSQVIRATDLPGKAMRTFGYSLSGGLDLDGNGYPDLAVGAYEADKIAVLRSRSVIKIKTEVKGTYKHFKPHKKGCVNDLNSTKTCFLITSCFVFKSAVPFTGRRSVIYLESRIEAETFSGKKFSRVSFNSSENLKQSNIVDSVIKFNSDEINTPRCKNHTVYLKDDSDILNPIDFKLSYSLSQQQPKAPVNKGILHNIDNYPILDQSEASKVFSATFFKHCGEDDKCNSDLHLKSSVDLPKVKGEDNAFNLVLHNGTFTLDIVVENRNESAYDANLFISHPVNIKMKKLLYEGTNIECLSNGTEISCSLGNPMSNHSTVKISLAFDPNGVSDRENVLPFNIFVNTSSINRKIEPINMEVRIIRIAEVRLIGFSQPSEVYYGGEVKGASAIIAENEIGPLVTHTYTVINDGPLTIRECVVDIDWPYEMANDREKGKFALYLMENPRVDVNGECYVDKQYVNPLNIKKKAVALTFSRSDSTTEASVDESITPKSSVSKERNKQQSLDYNDKDEDEGIPKKRKKREVVVLPEEVEIKGKHYKVVNVNCKDKTAKCFRFSCKIFNLGAGSSSSGSGSDSIIIKSRLWNNTFTEDYPDVNWLHIASNATLTIDPKFDIIQDSSDDFHSFVLIKLARTPEDINYMVIKVKPVTIDVLAIGGHPAGHTEVITKVTPDLLKFKDRQKKPVPIWIIVVAVLAGMFLLAIVILLLIKFGFFKRKKPGYVLTETNEKPLNDF